jgi:hypothetical protein
LDVVDEGLDTNGRICSSVLSWSAWLAGQTGGARLRLETGGGILDVGFARLGKTGGEMRGTGNFADINTGFAYVRDRIERELANAGLLTPNKLYAAYYGGSTSWSCGGGAWPPLLLGRVAAMYVKGTPTGFPGCESTPWGGGGL